LPQHSSAHQSKTAAPFPTVSQQAKTWKEKYSEYKELGRVFQAIDDVGEKIQKKKRRKSGN